MGYGIWDMGYGIWDMGYGIGIWDWNGIWDLGFGMGWDGMGLGWAANSLENVQELYILQLIAKMLGENLIRFATWEYLFLGYYEEFLSWREIVDLLVSISISLVSFMVRSNITEHGGVRGLLIPVYMDQQHLKIEEYHYT
ncbi:unnamed protein product [Rhizophagus irregularis]|nr:unnamed protein product [Rhizophagus irregularis]